MMMTAFSFGEKAGGLYLTFLSFYNEISFCSLKTKLVEYHCSKLTTEILPSDANKIRTKKNTFKVNKIDKKSGKAKILKLISSIIKMILRLVTRWSFHQTSGQIKKRFLFHILIWFFVQTIELMIWWTCKTKMSRFKIIKKINTCFPAFSFFFFQSAFKQSNE